MEFSFPPYPVVSFKIVTLKGFYDHIEAARIVVSSDKVQLSAIKLTLVQ